MKLSYIWELAETKTKKMSDFSIRQILNNITEGNLRIPAFQRGFVWDADSVAFLMDSIYKGSIWNNSIMENKE